MKINVYTLNINNYFPELMEITIPFMKKYAHKIGAEFIEINERKFPNYHIHYEKMQIYELGKDVDWNIFFDGDLLVNNSMFDISKSDNNTILLKDGFNVDIKFTMNKYFYFDKRKQGISGCFIATPKKCHNIWENLDLSPKEINSKIIVSGNDLNRGIDASFYQEEYVLSYNLAKYKYNFNGVKKDDMFHSYESNTRDIKLNEIKQKIKEWNL